MIFKLFQLKGIIYHIFYLSKSFNKKEEEPV